MMGKKTFQNRTIQIVAGPNGSGKTTFAESFLQNRSSIFINSDTIASGISPMAIEKAAIHAGRIMIEAIRGSLEKKESFSFESTLSGKTWIRMLEEARMKKYKITIYFIFLKNVSENLKRIKARVISGGHFVPKAIVLRRFPRSFYNFWNFYRNLCDHWFIFDNTETKPTLIHSKASFENLNQEDQKKFEVKFLKGKQNGNNI
ncbi:MAG: AAA family ATPase [Bdellovibrio sp.]|nr:AAA family ATPase [Bdellovibrio sp.]